MTNPWFRFYSEVLNDPKVQQLEASTFKFWINFLCVANLYDGSVPEECDWSFHMRMSKEQCETFLQRLHETKLLVSEGGYIVPKGWNARQFKSDNSTERVKKFRAKQGKTEGNTETKRNVSETPQNRTEQNRLKRKDKKKNSEHPDFVKFKKAFPERKGSHNWPTASNRFTELVETKQAEPEALVASARRYASAMKDIKDRQGVQQAATFLGQKETWREFLPSETSANRSANSVEIFKGTPEWNAWYLHDKDLPYFQRLGQSGQQDWWELSRVLKPSKFPEQERKSA